jgi:hypothetical protein
LPPFPGRPHRPAIDRRPSVRLPDAPDLPELSTDGELPAEMSMKAPPLWVLPRLGPVRAPCSQSFASADIEKGVAQSAGSVPIRPGSLALTGF